MASPVGFNVKGQFDNLAHVMEQMSKQTFTHDAEGKKVYDKSDKVYVKLGENDRLVTDIGTQAKREKGVTAKKLAETVEKVIHAAAESGSKVFDKTDIGTINNMIAGMEALKDRMKAAQQSMSPLKKFLLRAFGYLDQYDAAINKM
jgi:hypothetical protein